LSLVLDEHRQYLSDVPRLTAFRRAIEAVVRPGDVVVDLGSGTGILGLLACRAGATRVYSLEGTSMIGVGREISRANGFADRMIFLKGFSIHLDIPEPVDVVVADQIGRFGFEAGVFEYFTDARARFLKPGGVTIPSQVALVVAPVETDEMWAQVDFWDTRPSSVDVTPGRTIARNTGYPVKYTPENLLGAPAVLASLATDTHDGVIRGRVAVEIERPGHLHGIGGWFSAELAPGITMTNSPLSDERINRHNVYFPVDRAVEVAPGDRVELDMHIVTAQVMVRWDVTVLDAAGAVKASSRHSTFEGMLVCKEDLMRGRPDFRPTLTARGVARRTVLELCDGDRTLDDLERELQRRHPELFPKLKDAALFAAEVVTRYAT
jgi:protein arginine N-methyltransferase 1